MENQPIQVFSISSTEAPQKPFMNIIFSEGDFGDSRSVCKKNDAQRTSSGFCA